MSTFGVVNDWHFYVEFDIFKEEMNAFDGLDEPVLVFPTGKRREPS